jgi:hypothetical protein
MKSRILFASGHRARHGARRIVTRHSELDVAARIVPVTSMIAWSAESNSVDQGGDFNSLNIKSLLLTLQRRTRRLRAIRPLCAAMRERCRAAVTRGSREDW